MISHFYSRVEEGPDDAVRSAIVRGCAGIRAILSLSQRAESLQKIPLHGRRTGHATLLAVTWPIRRMKDFKRAGFVEYVDGRRRLNRSFSYMKASCEV